MLIESSIEIRDLIEVKNKFARKINTDIPLYGVYPKFITHYYYNLNK